MSKDFYKKVFIITLPIVLQNLLDAAVNSADVLMLNFVGQESISACSLASQYSSIIFFFFFGISAGVSILAAQYYGKGDLKSVEKCEGIALRYAIIVAAILALLCTFFPKTLMRIYTPDPVLIELGATYLKIVGVGMIFWSISTVYCATLRSVERVVICTVLEAIALLTNVGLNAVFIFGLFGAPKLGLAGVALATTISRVLQFICCLVVSYFSKDVKLRFRYIFQNNKLLRKDFVKMSVPAIVNDVVWGLAFSMYSLIFGHLGDDVVAANSLVSTVRGLGTVLCYGLASASGILVGQILGTGAIEEAKKAAKTFLRLSVYAGILGGLVVLALKPVIMGIANISDVALDYLGFMLLVNTVYITGTAVNTTLIAGVFRSGGETKFGMICDFVDMWIYAVPLGLLAAFVFKLPVKIVYLLLCTDEFVKWPWVFKHFHSEKWAKNITRDNLEETAA